MNIFSSIGSFGKKALLDEKETLFGALNKNQKNALSSAIKNTLNQSKSISNIETIDPFTSKNYNPLNLLKQYSDKLYNTNTKYNNPYEKIASSLDTKDFEIKSLQERLAGSTKKNISNENDEDFSIDFNKYSNRYNKNNNEEKDK